MNAYLQHIIPQIIDEHSSMKAASFTANDWWVQYSNKSFKHYSFDEKGAYSANHQHEGTWVYTADEKILCLHKHRQHAMFQLLYRDVSVVVFESCHDKGNYMFMLDASQLHSDQLIPYFKGLYYRKNQIATLVLDQNLTLEIHQYNPKVGLLNNKVSIHGVFAKDGKYKGHLSQRKIEVRQHRIVKVLVDKTYKTPQGTIVIEKQELHKPQVGDAVFKNGLPAEDGIYLIGFQTISVRNGIIIK